MSSFWKILILLVINILVSVFSTLAVLYYWENIRNAEKPYTLVVPEETEISLESTQIVDYGILAVTDTPVSDPGETQPVSTDEETDQTTSTPGFVLPPVRGAAVTISQVIGVGDTNTEAVQILSTSDTAVSLANWTLEDADGNVFTFPDIQLIRRDIFIEVYSRSGHNTPFELYWGQSEPVWKSGETTVIKDADGNIQATYRIP